MCQGISLSFYFAYLHSDVQHIFVCLLVFHISFLFCGFKIYNKKFSISNSHWQTLTCFLSLWICLFWIFHIYRIIQEETFMSGFFHSVYYFQASSMLKYIPTSLLFTAEWYSFLWVYHTVFSFISFWTFGLFLPLGILNNAAVNFVYMVLFECMLSILWGYISRIGIAWSNYNFTFILLRNC